MHNSSIVENTDQFVMSNSDTDMRDESKDGHNLIQR